MSKYWTTEKLIENISKCQNLFGHHGLTFGAEEGNRVTTGKAMIFDSSVRVSYSVPIRFPYIVRLFLKISDIEYRIPY